MVRLKLIIMLAASLLTFSCVQLTSTNPSTEGSEPINREQLASPAEGLLTLKFLGLHQLGEKNGDSTLVITPDGNTVLIDAGNGKNYPQLKALLEQAGIETLDYVVFTHFHGDHTGDMKKLTKDFIIGKVLMLDFPEAQGSSAEERDALMKILAIQNIPYGYLAAGDILEIAPGVDLHCLSPVSPVQYDATVVDERTRTIYENQHSLVFQLRYRNHVFLFAGDIYKETEYELIQRYGERLRSDVLKVPHHGLSTSSSTAFLLQVLPSLSVVLSGEPTESTLNSLRYRNRTLTTVAYGTITVVSDGANLQVITEHEDTTRGIYSE